MYTKKGGIRGVSELAGRAGFGVRLVPMVVKVVVVVVVVVVVWKRMGDGIVGSTRHGDHPWASCAGSIQMGGGARSSARGRAAPSVGRR